MEIDIKITGLEEVKRMLGELPKKVARKVLRKGVMSGAGFLRNEIKKTAPVRQGYRFMQTSRYGIRTPGHLKKNISARFRRKSSGDTEIHYSVGPRGQAFYGFFVEAGHRVGRRRKNGVDKRVMVPPHPFMVPQFENNKDRIIDRIKRKLVEGIVREGEAMGLKGDARP